MSLTVFCPHELPIVLETLVIRSLAEDMLGTIQRDIPKVLDAFCDYLTAVEDAREELARMIKPDTPIEKKAEIYRGIELLDPLHHSLFSQFSRIFL